MNGIFEILEKIQVKPGMYIGKASVSDLFMFLVGYKTARRELEIELEQREADFCENFQPWLQRKFEVLTTVKSWATIILLQCQDEKEAFYYFFKLLDEFEHRDKSLDIDPLVEAMRKSKVKH